MHFFLLLVYYEGSFPLPLFLKAATVLFPMTMRLDFCRKENYCCALLLLQGEGGRRETLPEERGEGWGASLEGVRLLTTEKAMLKARE